MYNNNTEISNEFDAQLWSEFLQTAIKDESYWVQVVFAVLMCTIFVVSLVGNLLTCIVIYTDRSMHTATNFYIFNLAVSDLFVTFAILLDVYEHMSDSYQFGNLTCKIHFFLVVALWNNSILIMTALAIERYIVIWYPLLLNSTPVWRRVLKVIVFIWIVAILESLPEIWTVELTKTKKSTICYTIPTKFARILNGILALVTFVIPLGIMIFVYAMIAFKVNVTVRTTSRDKIFNQRDNRSKVNKLIVALTFSFLVCWFPFFTMRVLLFALDMRQLMQLPKWWGIGHKVVSFNNWFSIVLNPMLFSLMSTKFRKSLKALWSMKFKRNQSNMRRISIA